MSLRLATAPVSWGIWEQTIERTDLVPPERLLETITEMGYSAIESGPPGYLAPTGAAAVELIRPFGVEIVATLLPLRLDNAAEFAEDLEALDQTAEVLAATGDGLVILADQERPERARAAGQPDRLRATGWPETTFDLAAEHLEIARARCTERGLRASFHPHAATYVESPEEIDMLLARTPPELGLCLDTGHTVVGGGDPLDLVRRYADRLVHLHLKDVDRAVLDRLRAGLIDMDEAWKEGIFCPSARASFRSGSSWGSPRFARSTASPCSSRIGWPSRSTISLPCGRSRPENLRRIETWLA